MRLILLFFIPLLSHALTTTDRMKVQILKVYDQNILVLNRGLEDGIVRSDHIKLTTEDGFIARGICIKEGMLSSHWKIYRVIKPELVSKDTVYNLNAINQSEVPRDIERLYANVNFENKFKDWDEKNLNKQLKLQQRRFAKYDFPKSTDGTDIFLEDTDSVSENMISKNFNKKKFIKDMEPLTFTLYASPYSTQTLNDQQTANYGMNIHNKGEKYDLIFNYSDYYVKLSDPIQDKSVIRAQNIMNSELIIKDFTRVWNLTSYVQYDNARYGGIYTPRSHIKFAPFGMQFEIEPKNGISYTDLSYFLFYDQRVDDKLEFDDDGSNYQVDQKSTSRMRHGFRFRTQGKMNKNVTFFNELWYQPAMSLSTWSIDTKDVDLHNTFRISVLLSEKFYLDFENHYTHDILQYENYRIDPSIIANVVHFRYNFDI